MIPPGFLGTALGMLEGQILVLREKAAFPRQAPWIFLPRDERAPLGFGLLLPHGGGEGILGRAGGSRTLRGKAGERPGMDQLLQRENLRRPY